MVGQPEIFSFPQKYQTVTQHAQLFEVVVMKGVVKSFNTRNIFRKVIISLIGELQTIYLDTKGNVVFHEYYLEEAQTSPTLNLQNSPPDLPIQNKPMHSIAKNMIIDKFDHEKGKVKVWLGMFTTECKRLDTEENKLVEVLRLFLEKSALHWYMNLLRINPLTHPWEFWNNLFSDTFTQVL